MKIDTLFVSWSMPPAALGSAIIVGNLAKQFSTEEMALVGEMVKNNIDHEWQKNWPKRFYISYPWPKSWRGAFWVRLAQLPWLILCLFILSKRYQSKKILVVFPDEVFAAASYCVCKLTGIDLFVYMHNTYLENRQGVRKVIAKFFQQYLFNSAKHIFTISDALTDFYRSHYKLKNCTTLVHTFCEEQPVFENLPRMKSSVELVICGNVNASCQESVVRIAKLLGYMPKFNLTMMSAMSQQELNQVGVLFNYLKYKTCSRDNVVHELKKYDIVILPHGFSGSLPDEEYLTIFPTKTIEYLLCGRPILAHVPRNSFIAQFLHKHDCAFIVEEASDVALEKALRRLQEDYALCCALVKNALKTASLFQAHQVSKTLRDFLSS